MALRPYNFTVCQRVLRSLLSDLEILAGDKVCTDASVHSVLATAMTNATVLANQLQAAHASIIVNGPLVFPSPNDRGDET